MSEKNTFGAKRNKSVWVKTAKGRKISSTLWLHRQLNDPYVQAAKQDGYRSRAAYKLIEIDDKFHFLKPGVTVVDLGAAPGGWTQVSVARTKAGEGKNKPVIALDILEMPPIPGAEFIQLDFMDDSAPSRLMDMLGGIKANIVLSDMAPNTTGHAATDHIRILSLCEAGYDFACEILAEGGVFLAKVRQGGTEEGLLARMRKDFTTIKHVKPKASRTDSAEMYVYASGFRGMQS